MDIHMGKIVRNTLERKGMKKSEFAKRINITSQNVYDIFKRKSIDSNLLLKISIILETNLFKVYEEIISQKGFHNIQIHDSHVEYESSNEKLVEQLENKNKELHSLQEKVKSLEKELEYLKEINSLLKNKKN